MGASPETDFRLLLATSRPAVHTFFAGLALRSRAPLLVERIEVAPEQIEADAVEWATVVAVDAALEPGAALELCRELHGLRPSLPVAALVCCPHAVTPWSLNALLAEGVSGVLDLQASAEETARALESVAEGDSVLHLHLRRGQRAILRDVLAGRASRGETQLRLLELVTLGLTDYEIGRCVQLSPHTVKHHIEQLRNEVSARNRTELAAWAGRHGFYAPDAHRHGDVVSARPRR